MTVIFDIQWWIFLLIIVVLFLFHTLWVFYFSYPFIIVKNIKRERKFLYVPKYWSKLNSRLASIIHAIFFLILILITVAFEYKFSSYFQGYWWVYIIGTLIVIVFYSLLTHRIYLFRLSQQIKLYFKIFNEMRNRDVPEEQQKILASYYFSLILSNADENKQLLDCFKSSDDFIKRLNEHFKL